MLAVLAGDEIVSFVHDRNMIDNFTDAKNFMRQIICCIFSTIEWMLFQYPSLPVKCKSVCRLKNNVAYPPFGKKVPEIEFAITHNMLQL